MKRLLFVIILLTLALVPLAVSQDVIDALDRYIESARQDWNIPGMSVVVVQDGKVVLAKGYGIRELGKNDPVDAQTLFGVMSTTKAMTAVAMGLLVDEGKVSWRDKVVKHLPDFRVGDPYITAELEVSDLFTVESERGSQEADGLQARGPARPPLQVAQSAWAEPGPCGQFLLREGRGRPIASQQLAERGSTRHGVTLPDRAHTPRPDRTTVPKCRPPPRPGSRTGPCLRRPGPAAAAVR